MYLGILCLWLMIMEQVNIKTHTHTPPHPQTPTHTHTQPPTYMHTPTHPKHIQKPFKLVFKMQYFLEAYLISVKISKFEKNKK